ncbi:NAD(P)-binding domain-containing protein [Humisphaera borealis]|uniref:NAD(P)-binding domain-containing protein n=1 Tax=Humisphaera borealis TaxID=2807512 RepID=A0A7M2WR83_9BACT|nr:NAD(P)-binding domain-containing protein [Humisphaera borealis]QOV87986.1 NAD(P)-binding domain-containing protein [Humisphaera borealis]
MSDTTDIAIIGGGPIGLELAVACQKAGLDYLHFEAGQIGQTISWFAPQTRFFSSNERIAIAGVPLQTADQSKASREEYLAYLRSIVLQFGLRVKCYEPIVGITSDGKGPDGGFILTSRRGAGGSAGATSTYRVRRIVLATGGTDRPRKLGIPGEDLPHVSHYFKDPHTYFRQNLLVVGGKNSAVEAALRCYQAAAQVAISYRRPELPAKSIKYWLLPEITGLTQAGRIAGHFATIPTHITGTHVSLQPVDAAFQPRGEPYDVPADFVLLMTGYEQDNTLLKLTGVKFSEDGECRPIFDERTMETNVPGVYVAGTATGGTQERYTVFLENCHVHIERIISALQGTTRLVRAPDFACPES